MKQKRILLLLIIVLFATDIILVNRTINCRKEIQIKDSVIRSIETSTLKSGYIESCLSYAYTFDRMNVIDTDLTDTLLRTIPIQQIVRNGPVFVFRYAERNCPDCIVFGLMQLKRLADSVSQRPVIFANYAEPYPFKRNTREMHPQGIPSYNIQNVLPDDELQTPYCFILHPDLRISEFFIPDKSFPKVTKRYIRTLSKKYFDGR